MSEENYGMVASFEDTPSLYHAAEKVRDAGFNIWDTFIFSYSWNARGTSQARSKVPIFTFVEPLEATGTTVMQYMNAFDYPLIVGGYPFFSPVFPFRSCMS